MHRLVLTGLNHTTAPLEVREKLAFPGDQRSAFLTLFHEKHPESEAVLLSTCNRIELYVGRSIHGHPRGEEMIEMMAAFHSLPGPTVAQHFYRKTDREAVTHVFSVASSLDSMVLGETQILGQVREAYDLACAGGTAGALLNPLFQRAISVGKQVMTQTKLSEGRVSVASVAVDHARQIFDHFADKTVLTIGAGKMTTLVIQNFQALTPGKLLICNRDPQKAVALAERFGGQQVPYESLDDHIVAADIVISFDRLDPADHHAPAVRAAGAPAAVSADLPDRYRAASRHRERGGRTGERLSLQHRRLAERRGADAVATGDGPGGCSKDRRAAGRGIRGVEPRPADRAADRQPLPPLSPGGPG